MRRALVCLAWIAVLVTPMAVGAQDAADVAAIETIESWPAWVRVLIFIGSLPYTLFMFFLEGERLYLLPAPLLALWYCFWSFREWRRQRYWTPRIIHIMAVLALATIILINVDWVMAGGEMWTQRYVVIAVFGLFPYAAYLVLSGPKVIGRERASTPTRATSRSPDPLGAPDTAPAQSRGRRESGSRWASRLRASFAVLGVVVVAMFGLVLAAGSAGPVSEARPDLDALFTARSPVPAVGGVAKGDPGARFTILVFGDYQCPACGRFSRAVQPRLDSAYVETGRAKLVFVDLPLTSIHDNAFLAARAARCARDQDGFWVYQDELYRRQETWAELAMPHDSFEEAAGALGLERSAFRACLDSDVHADMVEASRQLALHFRIRSTPTVVIGLEGAVPREVSRGSFRSISRTIEMMDSISGEG